MDKSCPQLLLWTAKNRCIIEFHFHLYAPASKQMTILFFATRTALQARYGVTGWSFVYLKKNLWPL